MDEIPLGDYPSLSKSSLQSTANVLSASPKIEAKTFVALPGRPKTTSVGATLGT